jgi:uroporphyrinogen decarboxylase
MNSRERILAAINHIPLDRVPTDIWATGEVMAKLKAHFGDEADIKALLHIDGFGGVGPKYIGPPLPAMPAGESCNEWGMRHKQVNYGTGTYMEQYFYPLADANSIDDLDRYRWPEADWYDFSTIADQARLLHPHKAIQAGYMAPFFYHNLTRGLERSLMDPLDDPSFTNALLDRICDFFHEYHHRLFESAKGMIDVAQVTDDLGSQTGPLISLEVFRTFYKPRMQRFIDLCHGFNIKVFHHDDGSCRQFLPDLVAMGIDILNPIQHNCPGMDMRELKHEFGRKLCFHGAIDNQQILPFGTPQQVRKEVRDAIDALTSDGTGYILAPCHNIQAVSPVENIIAMYDEAWNYGKLR